MAVNDEKMKRKEILKLYREFLYNLIFCVKDVLGEDKALIICDVLEEARDKLLETEGGVSHN